MYHFEPVIKSRKRSLRRLCFYTCLAFCSRGGGCIPACIAGGIPACLAAGLQGGMVVSQHPLQVSTPTPCSWGGGCGDTPIMAIAVGRTHPTGMHSCYNIFPKMDKNCHKIHKHYCQFYNPYSSILYFCHVMGSQNEIRYLWISIIFQGWRIHWSSSSPMHS